MTRSRRRVRATLHPGQPGTFQEVPESPGGSSTNAQSDGRKLGYSTLGLTGRTGNALFEFAATIGICRELNAQPRFNSNWSHRKVYSVPDEYFTDYFYDVTPVTEYAQHIDARCRMYLQDVGLFIRHLPEIREMLTLSDWARDQIDESLPFFDLPHPILSVHVRRGDNIHDAGVPDKHLYHRTPPLSYYKNMIDEKLDEGYESVAVFSDDPDWCEANLTADYFHRGLPRPKEHEKAYATAPVLDFVDMELMSQHCSGHIISGSTFGIWGALLADSDDVVYARPVYGPKLRYIDESLLFLPQWRMVNYEC